MKIETWSSIKKIFQYHYIKYGNGFGREIQKNLSSKPRKESIAFGGRTIEIDEFMYAMIRLHIKKFIYSWVV
ncbi:hypothetical protein BpHYR1_015635 [Brachionus plicatilis]|uniref:Uncharacterized protein n=1 Tax=Brachionus plicatilis TaxID=10195 RepID=A0A3M7PYV5_BRAPC|nr:hypothetical protein BpHYR1_015635 [Brachionus plicatilis]